MTDDLMKKLTSLAQLDRDATSVYDEALKHVTDEDVRTTFTDFRDEHEHHVTEISAAVERMGGQPLDLKVDAMGHMADWFAAFRSMGGQTGALKAMHTAEKYHNSRYAETLTWSIGDKDLADTLARFYAEEQRHLAYVDAKLAVHSGSPA
jgi:uncharacterized protein (TIGR02284 family)